MDIRRFAAYVLLVGAAVQLLLVAVAVWRTRELLSVLGVLAFEAVAMLIVYRIAMRLLRPEHAPAHVEPRADRRPPIAPMPDAELAGLPEPVRACPDCAFVGVRMPGIRDGLWPGGGELGDRVVCPRCGYQGLAIQFDTRADYGAFLRDMAGNSET